MNQLSLPLRQRQLLDYLQHANGYTTGAELSHRLNVTARTIRNDITEINRQLDAYQIQITAKHGFGYRIEASDIRDLRKLTQTSESFISRTERLRHIAYRLCLADTPIDLDDLADEMYISKTTLEHDLKDFRHKFVLPSPHIQMIRRKNSVVFEFDERKRRYILCHLYSSSWNYNARGNTFFHYRYLNEKLVNICIQEINFYLDKYNLQMEDTNVVHLNLMVAIAAVRLREGHELTDRIEDYYITPRATAACDELLDSLEERLNCSFPPIERREICQLMSCSMIPDTRHLQEHDLTDVFPSSLIQFAEQYLFSLKDAYGLDFRTDQDFYLSFLMYLRYLHMPVHYLNNVGLSRESAQRNSAIELELAFLIQPMALSHYGNYLDFTELLYLAALLKGAMSRALRPKLKAAILCHYNLPIAWKLRWEIGLRFAHDLEIHDLMPMYRKDNFDFSDTDLILTTTDKRNLTKKEIETIRISSDFTEQDEQAIRRYIEQEQFRRLYRKEFPPLHTLLSEADWYENLELDSYFGVLEFLGTKLIGRGCVSEEFLTDIFRRERIMTFACHAPLILVHSPRPANQTHIAVATLRHRINVGGKKIRTVVMICMCSYDRGLIFKLINELYRRNDQFEDARFLKTKTEFLHFLDDMTEI